MRLSITIPLDLADSLLTLAVQEHRYPKQQAEILLYRAIKDAMPDREPQPLPEVEDALTHP